jgi:hypothetical protein
MRAPPGLLLLALLFPVASPAFPEVDQARPSLHGSPAGESCPVRVVPGRSLGSLKLGMAEEELGRLKLVVKRVRDSGNWYVVGPYTARFDQGKLVQIHGELHDLPDCVRLGRRKIHRDAGVEQLRALFRKCGKDEMRLGGNLAVCDGIAIGTAGWGGRQASPSLRVPF